MKSLPTEEDVGELSPNKKTRFKMYDFDKIKKNEKIEINDKVIMNVLGRRFSRINSKFIK